MSKESFTAETTEVAPAPKNTSVAKYSDFSGEVAASDLILPRLHLVQKVGPLSENFTPGSIVFQKEVELFTLKDAKPLSLVVLQAKKRYQENVDFGSDEMGQVVDTIAEVKSKGGWIEYREGDKGREAPPWSERLDVVVCLQAPEGDASGLFPSVHASKSYVVACWTLAKSSYNAAGKKLLTARVGALKDAGFTGAWWNVGVDAKKGPKGAYYVPRFNMAGRTDAATREFLSSLYEPAE